MLFFDPLFFFYISFQFIDLSHSEKINGLLRLQDNYQLHLHKYLL